MNLKKTKKFSIFLQKLMFFDLVTKKEHGEHLKTYEKDFHTRQYNNNEVIDKNEWIMRSTPVEPQGGRK